VVIGVGQVNQHDDIPEQEPVDLMAAAAREAAEPRVLAAVDSIRVVNLLSWRYRDPGLLLGERIGAAGTASSADSVGFTTRYSAAGGNTPQSLVNQGCLDIRQGRNGLILIAGAELWRTRMRLRAKGIRPDWTKQPDSVPIPQGGEAGLVMSGPAEEKVGLDRPSSVYPIFEQALRIANGESTEAHRRRIGQLWAQFNAVAQGNPHAWSNDALTADQIWRPGPDNRMISWPYPKLMNSNNMVNQAAVLLLCSVEKAIELGISRDRWVFPQSGTDSRDTSSIAERDQLHRSPAIRLGGRRAMELAGVGVDDLDYVDIYSCFPSAVQVAANELGLPLGDADRPLTVTGGLTFAGGPWNNYVTHSIATMVDRLRENPGRRGLITANGGYLTKHSFGVYSTTPPEEFRWEDVQHLVDREPTRTGLVDWQGIGTVEAWTTTFDREGRPEKSYLAVRTPAEARTWALIDEAGAAAATLAEDIAGAKVKVGADGRAVLQ
jgi:acetyl-CoA C-acetyltransferase